MSEESELSLERKSKQEAKLQDDKEPQLPNFLPKENLGMQIEKKIENTIRSYHYVEPSLEAFRKITCPEEQQELEAKDRELLARRQDRCASFKRLGKKATLAVDFDETLAFGLSSSLDPDSKIRNELKEKFPHSWLTFPIPEDTGCYVSSSLWIHLIVAMMRRNWRVVFYSSAPDSHNRKRLQPFLGAIRSLATKQGCLDQLMSDAHNLEILSREDCLFRQGIGRVDVLKDLTLLCDDSRDVILLDDLSSVVFSDQSNSLINVSCLISPFNLKPSQLTESELPSPILMVPLFLMGLLHPVDLLLDEKKVHAADALKLMPSRRANIWSSTESYYYKQNLFNGIQWWTQVYSYSESIKYMLPWIPASLWNRSDSKNKPNFNMQKRPLCSRKCLKAATMQEWLTDVSQTEWSWAQILSEPCNYCECHWFSWAQGRYL